MEGNARHTCEITAREILECTWDDIAGVWNGDEMTVQDRSSRLLPIRADGRQQIGALEKVGQLRRQGGIFGKSEFRVVLARGSTIVVQVRTGSNIISRWSQGASADTYPDGNRPVFSQYPRCLWPHPGPVEPMASLCCTTQPPHPPSKYRNVDVSSRSTENRTYQKSSDLRCPLTRTSISPPETARTQSGQTPHRTKTRGRDVRRRPSPHWDRYPQYS